MTIASTLPRIICEKDIKKGRRTNKRFSRQLFALLRLNCQPLDSLANCRGSLTQEELWLQQRR